MVVGQVPLLGTEYNVLESNDLASPSDAFLMRVVITRRSPIMSGATSLAQHAPLDGQCRVRAVHRRRRHHAPSPVRRD